MSRIHNIQPFNNGATQGRFSQTRVGRSYMYHVAVMGSSWQLQGLRSLVKTYMALIEWLSRTPRNSHIGPVTATR